jgi:hypothetical protein
VMRHCKANRKEGIESENMEKMRFKKKEEWKWY